MNERMNKLHKGAQAKPFQYFQSHECLTCMTAKYDFREHRGVKVNKIITTTTTYPLNIRTTTT